MSNQPGFDNSASQPVEYDSGVKTSSGMALTSMILGIIGVVTGCLIIGIPISWVALILGIIALVKSNANPRRYGGKGFAITGLVTGLLGGVVMGPVLLVLILMPSLGKARELANRSYCAANLHGIVESMIVYSAENSDAFPTLPYAPYSPGNAGSSTVTGPTTADDTLKSYYAGSNPLAGSPTASLWILVLRDQCPPKQFICKSDPMPTSRAILQDGSKYYMDFQSDNQFSYSVAYPYDAKGNPGAWWKNLMDASLPIMSDMAPMNGTGSPSRNVCPGSMPSNAKSWNSGNHQGDGQNVAFGDAHTEFDKRPDVGQSNDNIFSVTGTADVSEYGGSQPIKSPPGIMSGTAAPFDIYMVPARNLDTGGL